MVMRHIGCFALLVASLCLACSGGDSTPDVSPDGGTVDTVEQVDSKPPSPHVSFGDRHHASLDNQPVEKVPPPRAELYLLGYPINGMYQHLMDDGPSGHTLIHSSSPPDATDEEILSYTKDCLGADIDGDGYDEILVVYFNAGDSSLKLKSIDYQDGAADTRTTSLVSDITSDDPDEEVASPSIATGDLDGDGRDELVVAFASTVYLIDDALADHQIIEQMSYDASRVYVATGDLDTDLTSEIVVSHGQPGQTGLLSIYDGALSAPLVTDWQLVSNNPPLFDVDSHTLEYAVVATGDILGPDGRDEIVLHGKRLGYSWNVLALSYDPTQKELKWLDFFVDALSYKASHEKTLAVFDFDGDGMDEIWASRFLIDDLNALQGDASKVTSFVRELTTAPKRVTAGDIDGDGNEELICYENTYEGIGISYLDHDLQSARWLDIPAGGQPDTRQFLSLSLRRCAAYFRFCAANLNTEESSPSDLEDDPPPRKYQLTVSFDNLVRPYGEENNIQPILIGLQKGDDASVVTFDITTDATIDSPVGEYPIVISNVVINNDNYDSVVLTNADATLTITERKLWVIGYVVPENVPAPYVEILEDGTGTSLDLSDPLSLFYFNGLAPMDDPSVVSGWNLAVTLPENICTIDFIDGFPVENCILVPFMEMDVATACGVDSTTTDYRSIANVGPLTASNYDIELVAGRYVRETQYKGEQCGSSLFQNTGLDDLLYPYGMVAQAKPFVEHVAKEYLVSNNVMRADGVTPVYDGTLDSVIAWLKGTTTITDGDGNPVTGRNSLLLLDDLFAAMKMDLSAQGLNTARNAAKDDLVKNARIIQVQACQVAKDEFIYWRDVERWDMPHSLLSLLGPSDIPPDNLYDRVGQKTMTALGLAGPAVMDAVVFAWLATKLAQLFADAVAAGKMCIMGLHANPGLIAISGPFVIAGAVIFAATTIAVKIWDMVNLDKIDKKHDELIAEASALSFSDLEGYEADAALAFMIGRPSRVTPEDVWNLLHSTL